jgi:hypothetical protein
MTNTAHTPHTEGTPAAPPLADTRTGLFRAVDLAGRTIAAVPPESYDGAPNQRVRAAVRPSAEPSAPTQAM